MQNYPARICFYKNKSAPDNFAIKKGRKIVPHGTLKMEFVSEKVSNYLVLLVEKLNG